MVKLITTDGKYLRDFGQGTTTDIERAHNYTDDEAWLLVGLYDYEIAGPALVGTEGPLLGDSPPPMHPGLNLVWAKFGDCWVAIGKEVAFLGTRAALRANERSVA